MFPVIENFRMFYEILLIVDAIAPSLSRISLDILKDKDKVERLFKKIPDIVDDESFAHFIRLFWSGYTTKAFLKLLFDDISHLSDKSFYHCLIDYRYYNLVTFVGECDKERKIFKGRLKSWYFIPLFIFHADVVEEKSSFDKILPQDTVVSYNLIKKNIFIKNWILPLLHISCHSFTVKKDEKKNTFLGSLSEIQAKILLDKNSLKIRYTGYETDFLDTYGIEIMVKGIKEYIKEHPVLNNYINPKFEVINQP